MLCAFISPVQTSFPFRCLSLEKVPVQVCRVTSGATTCARPHEPHCDIVAARANSPQCMIVFSGFLSNTLITTGLDSDLSSTFKYHTLGLHKSSLQRECSELLMNGLYRLQRSNAGMQHTLAYTNCLSAINITYFLLRLVQPPGARMV